MPVRFHYDVITDFWQIFNFSLITFKFCILFLIFLPKNIANRHFDVKNWRFPSIFATSCWDHFERNGFHRNKERSMLNVLVLKLCLLILEKSEYCHKFQRNIFCVSGVTDENLEKGWPLPPPALTSIAKLIRRPSVSARFKFFFGGVAGSEDFACATLPTTPLDFQGKI